MEDIINKPNYIIPHSKPSSPPLAMHKNSQTISKTKPKIRIIHLFAPEIIKTDVENFRELVQRLTGKPDDNCKKRRTRRNPNRREEEPRSSSSSSELEKPVMVVTQKAENRSTFLGLEAREKVKEEEEEEEEMMMMWNGVNSGDFLNGFADFDGFIQELGEFPLLPL